MLCKRCGFERQLTDFYCRPDGRLRTPCKVCFKQYRAKYDDRNPGKRRQSAIQWCKDNRLRHNLYSRQWRAKHRSEIRPYNTERQRRNRINLTDGYVRSAIGKNWGLKAGEISNQLVILVREQILAYRLIKAVKEKLHDNQKETRLG